MLGALLEAVALLAEGSTLVLLLEAVTLLPKPAALVLLRALAIGAKVVAGIIASRARCVLLRALLKAAVGTAALLVLLVTSGAGLLLEPPAALLELARVEAVPAALLETAAVQLALEAALLAVAGWATLGAVVGLAAVCCQSGCGD